MSVGLRTGMSAGGGALKTDRPTNLAVAFILPKTSEPAPGSDIARAPKCEPSSSEGRYLA